MDGFEIDFIPIDSGQRNGDAITIRVRENGQDTVYVYDGGTIDTGNLIVEHIQKYYETDKVDYLISSHPDNDHVSGLRTVIQKLKVKELWMHRPWNHVPDIIDQVKDGRSTTNSVSKLLEDGLAFAKELEDLATKMKIPIQEPFQGREIGSFTVLSPSDDWYIELLATFKEVPETKSDTHLGAIVDKNMSAHEIWGKETLPESVSTSPENESSTVLYANLLGTEVLLTADAGCQALQTSIEYSNNAGIDLKNCSFIHLPHHGSSNNVTSSILNQLLGTILPKGTKVKKTSFSNISKDCKTHPKQTVTNAFKRRGVKVCLTKGKTICLRRGFPVRSGWSSLKELPFYGKIED